MREKEKIAIWKKPEILKSKVKLALNKMNRNKAAGPDGIVIEMLSALNDFGSSHK